MPPLPSHPPAIVEVPAGRPAAEILVSEIVDGVVPLIHTAWSTPSAPRTRPISLPAPVGPSIRFHLSFAAFAADAAPAVASAIAMARATAPRTRCGRRLMWNSFGWG